MSSPFEPFGSQDVHDDDAQVIDSLFIETDAPPDLKEATEPIYIRALEQPRKITRLITGDITIAPDWSPFLVLPADANRKGINIRVYSPTQVATDGARFADDLGNLLTAGKILHGGSTVFDNHTGAIYAVPCGAAANGAASAPVSLEFWSVTE